MSIALRNPNDISTLVKDQRVHLGLTQTELADRASVSLRWLAGLEAGSPGASVDKVMRLLDALGITVMVDIASSVFADDDASAADDLDAILRDHTTDGDVASS